MILNRIDRRLRNRMIILNRIESRLRMIMDRIRNNKWIT